MAAKDAPQKPSDGIISMGMLIRAIGRVNGHPDPEAYEKAVKAAYDEEISKGAK